MASDPHYYDCIIIGAGPGGLQAAIHLARYNRNVLIIDRGGGRTRHAARMVNYLGLAEVSGKELVDTGVAQVKSFGVFVEKQTVTRYLEILADEDIPVVSGDPVELLGEEQLQGIRLEDGTEIACEAVMLSLGYRLNDAYLQELPLDRDGEGFKILTNAHFESSVSGLYVVGALKPGHAQAIIAAGQGATVAIDINQRMLDI